MASHLLLGGARSGKSRLAEQLAHQSALEVTVIVTAEALDAEMSERIRRHQLDRPTAWRTIEAPLGLAHAMAEQAAENRCVIVDCLTLWLGNLMDGSNALPLPLDARGLPRLQSERAALLDVLPRLPGEILLVANEVGLGLVPETPLGRLFRDEAGRLNQVLAGLCDQVSLVVAGLPLRLK